MSKTLNRYVILFLLLCLSLNANAAVEKTEISQDGKTETLVEKVMNPQELVVSLVDTSSQLEPVTKPVPVTKKSIVELLLELTGILIVLLAIFWFGLRLRTQLLGRSIPHKKNSKKLKISERISLGGRFHIVIVDYEGEQVMVGLTPAGMFHIKDVKESGARSQESEVRS